MADSLSKSCLPSHSIYSTWPTNRRFTGKTITINMHCSRSMIEDVYLGHNMLMSSNNHWLLHNTDVGTRPSVLLLAM